MISTSRILIAWAAYRQPSVVPPFGLQRKNHLRSEIFATSGSAYLIRVQKLKANIQMVSGRYKGNSNLPGGAVL
jgi:hypothetical protein